MWKSSHIVKPSKRHKHHFDIQNKILFLLTSLFLHRTSKTGLLRPKSYCSWHTCSNNLPLEALCARSLPLPLKRSVRQSIPMSLPISPHLSICSRRTTSVHHIYCSACPLVSCWTLQRASAAQREMEKGQMQLSSHRAPWSWWSPESLLPSRPPTPPLSLSPISRKGTHLQCFWFTVLTA